MFGRIITKGWRVFAVIYFGLLILRWCGPRLFLSKMAHQIYGRTVFLGTKGQLDASRPSSSFQCVTNLATPGDVDELFGKIREESPEGRYELLVRKWYHKRGLGDCYIARVVGTNEICAVRWVVTPEHVKRLGWEDRFPLEDDEIMFENLYTFEKYRREGARTTSAVQVRNIVRQQGYKYNRGYVDVTNIPQLRWGEKTGSKVYVKVLERHFLFHVTRKTLEKYDPPVLMATFLDDR